MIIYLTKETVERYKIDMPEDFTNPVLGSMAKEVIKKESDNRLAEWGGKLFYFDRKKCLQVVNFASKFTLILVDVKVKDIVNIGNLIANYLLKIYENNSKMLQLLEKYFEEHFFVCFSKLKDKSIISTLNRTQLYYLDDGYHLYDYIKNGILHTVELNTKINCDFPFTQKIDGKTEYIYPAERFEELLCEKYSS